MLHPLLLLQPPLYLPLQELLPPVERLDLLLGPLPRQSNASELVLQSLVESPHDPSLQPLLLPLLGPPLDEPPPLLLYPLPQLLLPLDEVDEVLPVAEVGGDVGVPTVRDGDLVAEPEQVVLQLSGVLVHLLLLLHVVGGGLGQSEAAHRRLALRLRRGRKRRLGEVVRSGEDAVEGEDLLPELDGDAPEVGRVLQSGRGGDDDPGQDRGEHGEQEEKAGLHVLSDERAGVE